MKIQKSQAITAGLLIMTLFLVGLIVFIGIQLTNQNVEQAPIAPKKTKAQSTNYNKLITVNQKTGAQDISPTIAITPTSIPLISPKLSPTETILALAKTTGSPTPKLSTTVTVTPVTSLTPSMSITPSMSLTPANGATLSGTVLPTKPKSLPKTGIITNSIIMFGAAGLLVFFSFIL